MSRFKVNCCTSTSLSRCTVDNPTKTRTKGWARQELLVITNRLVLLNRSNRFAKDVARELDAIRTQVFEVIAEIEDNRE